MSFGDTDETVFDVGGIVTATPIPFEFSPTLSLGIFSAVFAIQKGRKRLQFTKKALAQLETEHSQS
ncbi:PFE-CTERM domain-containing protein [Trichormus azollae]|uniref:PFE-CTERM domain-containing protein n=1 Tax=Trichormus azollae TaxID=1164 RepID=UPI003D32D467